MKQSVCGWQYIYIYIYFNIDWSINEFQWGILGFYNYLISTHTHTCIYIIKIMINSQVVSYNQCIFIHQSMTDISCSIQFIQINALVFLLSQICVFFSYIISSEFVFIYIKRYIDKCSFLQSSNVHIVTRKYDTLIHSPGYGGRTCNLPAQRFFGRQLRSVLPMIKKFLSPFNAEEMKTKIQKAKQQQKKHSEKNAHDLTELRKGDPVTVQPYGKNQYWKKATGIEKFKHWQYVIELENGKRLEK